MMLASRVDRCWFRAGCAFAHAGEPLAAARSVVGLGVRSRRSDSAAAIGGFVLAGSRRQRIATRIASRRVSGQGW